MGNNIDLAYVARALGTTNFKLIHGDTGIIMFDPSRNFARKMQRHLDKKKPGQKPKMYYPKSVHLVKKNQISPT